MTDVVNVSWAGSPGSGSLANTLARELNAARERIAELEQELHNRYRVIDQQDYPDLHSYVEGIISAAHAATGSTILPLQTRIIRNELGDGWRAKKELVLANKRIARLTEAAKAVQKIADRNTDEFNALRAALAEEREQGELL
jgi:hypothetical protein